MTKFTKGVLTLGLLAGLGVGGYYGYNYLDDRGYFDDINTTNVPKETVTDIETFLNDVYNIGFVQANYESFELNSLSIDTIAYLLNNPYEKGSDGRLKKLDIANAKLYREFILRYDSNLLNIRVCYNAVKINEYLYSITNQYMKSLENTEEVCTAKLNNYIYMVDLKADKVIAKNDIYTVEYTIKDAESTLYNQRYGYTDIDSKKYKGTVVLKRIEDRYIFISNDMKSARSLYNIK